MSGALRRSRATGAAWLGLLVLGCGAEAPPEGSALVPVLRLVEAARTSQGPLTLDLPTATIRDDTRSVLRAPVRGALFWPTELEDRSGNRVVKRLQPVPAEFGAPRRLLVLPAVKVGGSWSEPPPQVLRADPSGVPLEFPIPANPLRRRVVISAQAYALDGNGLADLRIGPVRVPEDAVLEFAVGVVEPDWGFDPVEFRVLACRKDDCETVFSAAHDPGAAGAGGWSEHRVSLREYAGRTLSLRFEARRLRKEAPFTLPVWANPTLYVPAPRGESGRNVILLSVDTLRADHLTSYGYRHDTAPFADERFAGGGTVFDTLVAAATITTPSHATMFTSLTPAAHGTLDGLKALPRDIPTLAEWIRHEGRDTAAITEDGWLSVRHGFGRGFDRFVENRSADIMEPEGRVDRTFAQAAEWLTRNRDKRFFLFLHTFQVHTPYAPPPEYAGLFADDEDGPIDASSPSHLRWMADYDREIRYLDDELRRLFETVDALGLGADTVFILTSDHGEAFLEHGYLEHGARLDEEVVHVPLMLWGAGVPAGRRVRVPVAHVDLMPTILDLMGLPAPAWVEGASLVPFLDGSAAGLSGRLAERPLYSESRGTISLGPDRTLRRFQPPAYLVRLGQRKLTRYIEKDGSYRYEYYDLGSDPQERRDLYPERAEQARDLFELLEGYEERGRELRARIDGGNAGGDADVELDPRQEEKLRALGYLRDAPSAPEGEGPSTR